jgi:hypothetical protein
LSSSLAVLLLLLVLGKDLLPSRSVEVGLSQLDKVMVFGVDEEEEVEVVEPTKEATCPESVSSGRNITHCVEVDSSNTKLMTIGGEVHWTQNEEVKERAK